MFQIDSKNHITTRQAELLKQIRDRLAYPNPDCDPDFSSFHDYNKIRLKRLLELNLISMETGISQVPYWDVNENGEGTVKTLVKEHVIRINLTPKGKGVLTRLFSR